MKFIWETEDVTAGRQVRRKELRNYRAMVFADNAIGGPDRFGLVDLQKGLVFTRGKSQKLLAELLTEQVFVPVALTFNDGDTDCD